jgi:predicted component of type VI protein secretion system
MQVKLKVLTGNHAGKEIPFKDDKFYVGRSEECQLRPKSESVSRRHCVFIQKDGRVYLADLKSRNGTYVGDVRLEPEKAKSLKSGDKIRIGQLEFEIFIELSLGGAKKPEIRSVAEAANRVAESGTATVDGGGTGSADIDSWLSEPDTFDRSRLPVSGPDTKMLTSEDTTRVRVENKNEDSGEGADDDSTSGKQLSKKNPIKLPKMQLGPKTKNSKDAASDALKRYFGGR